MASTVSWKETPSELALIIHYKTGMHFFSSSSSSRKVWFTLSNVIACKHLSFSPSPAPRQASCLSTPVYRGIPDIPCFEAAQKGVEKEKNVFKVAVGKHGEGNWTKVPRFQVPALILLLVPALLLALAALARQQKQWEGPWTSDQKKKSEKGKVRNCGLGCK